MYNDHAHPFIGAILGFCFGSVLVSTILSFTDPQIRESTLNDKIVLNSSTDGREHTCGYITEDGVTEHLKDYAERCPDDVIVTPKTGDK